MNVSHRAVVVVVGANLAQLPTAMRPLVIVLLGHHNTGDYAVAGTAAAAGSIGMAVTAPLWGRLLVSRGHRLVLCATTAAAAAAQLALAVMSHTTGFIALAAVAGLTSPPAVSSGRALLPALVPGSGLSRAYTGNALAQELTYVLGPLWVVWWSTAGGPPAALVACAALGVIAVAAMLAAVPREQAAPSAALAGPPTALRRPAVRTVSLVHLSYMAAIGAMWVLLPGFASTAGDGAGAPWLVTAWSLGSLAGGAAIAVRGRRRGLADAYLRRLALLAGTSGLPALAGTMTEMALAVLVFGIGLSPWLATADELTARAATAAGAGEAYGWQIAAGQAGSAVGSAVAAAVIAGERVAGPPFLLVTVPLGIALVLAVTRRRTLAAGG
ncbi:MFS transporter [Jiangella ureilytica]|uniref:MFS transporter n=1 Tax=Jiangella ureilytica TaxID=2530374 RepID=A0A4R4RSH3_9ACTN|nr:MFS transporter [Jiangella ureilytica]TDC52978.1 MFS transporter [Jiangella ureilytica]